jgi:cytochrome c-type biogenesis protein CcmH/NrfF
MPAPKNVLLVNPWIDDFTAYDFWVRPLGLLVLGAVLRQGMDCRLQAPALLAFMEKRVYLSNAQ